MFAVVDTDTNPLASTVAGAGVSDAMVGAPAEVVVQTVDCDGQPRTSGGEVVGVMLVRRASSDGGEGGEGGSGDGGEGCNGGGAIADGGGGAGDEADRVVANVIDVGDGSYVCSYAATTAEGAWQLEVRVGGNQIQGSPFAIRVLAGGVRFVYSGTPFDTEGVLHWIGTGKRARAYASTPKRTEQMVGWWRPCRRWKTVAHFTLCSTFTTATTTTRKIHQTRGCQSIWVRPVGLP
jgi:hypothetical protein